MPKIRLTKIYTRTGDDGTTGLANGSRIHKDTLRIEVIGSLDTLNATIGIVIAYLDNNAFRSLLSDIQNCLFDLGGELALPDSIILKAKLIDDLEEQLDKLNKPLGPLTEFILPGGHKAAAFTHLARTQCRNCERQLLSLSRAETINSESLRYLNRLSDLLFVLARSINKEQNTPEPTWQR